MLELSSLPVVGADLDTKQTKFSVGNIFILIPDSGSSALYLQAEGSQGRGSCRVPLVQHDLVDRPIVCICIFICCVNNIISPFFRFLAASTATSFTLVMVLVLFSLNHKLAMGIILL